VPLTAAVVLEWIGAIGFGNNIGGAESCGRMANHGNDRSPRKGIAVAGVARACAGDQRNGLVRDLRQVGGHSGCRVGLLPRPDCPRVLIPLRLFSRGTSRVAPGAGALALAGGAFFALDLALYNTAVLKTHAATAALLGNLTPIFVGLGTWLLFHRRPGGAFWTGLLLALAGCAAIVSGDATPHAGAQPVSVMGDVLATVAALFFAGYLMTTERVRTGMDTLTFNVLAVAGSVLTLLAICVVDGEPLTGYTAKTWMALLGLGLFSQLGAYLALVYALGHLPATITSVGLLGQVPLTAALALVLLDEPLSAVKIVGGCVVLLGIYVVNRRAIA